jgi:hypothetical protein
MTSAEAFDVRHGARQTSCCHNLIYGHANAQQRSQEGHAFYSTECSTRSSWETRARRHLALDARSQNSHDCEVRNTLKRSDGATRPRREAAARCGEHVLAINHRGGGDRADNKERDIQRAQPIFCGARLRLLLRLRDAASCATSRGRRPDDKGRPGNMNAPAGIMSARGDREVHPRGVQRTGTARRRRATTLLTRE